MTQGVLPFKYETERQSTGMTALSGLPLYLDLIRATGLNKSIHQHLKVRKNGQGWTDNQIVLSLMLLNLAGGDCVEDIKLLEADDGFCKIFNKAQMHGLRQKDRAALSDRWRKEKTRSVPSTSSIFRYLEKFHNSEQEKVRAKGKAFIPAQNKHLQSFIGINNDLAAFSNYHDPGDTATLDMDATIIETSKANALYCYKGHKAYQPLNTWWAEQEIMLHTEFRDGNVPPGFQQLRVFKNALSCLPDGVKSIRLRSDTAGYQRELWEYCAKGKSSRFGVIEFVIGSDVTPAFKKAVSEVEEAEWKPLHKTIDGIRYNTGIEWAEVCFVPLTIGHSKKGPEYRYLVKRDAFDEQLELPGMESQLSLPFQTMDIKKKRYKIFGLITNMDWDGEELIHWYYERCGKSEAAHAVMKDDLAGGKLPSDDFGENAAWWWIMILAHNLNSMMKRFALDKGWASKRMKALRFSIINLPGRVIERSRALIIRLTNSHPSFELLINARKRIAMLQSFPSG